MCKIRKFLRACGMVFSDDYYLRSSPDEIRWIQNLLGGLEASDLGIVDSEIENGNGDHRQGIKYIHLYDCNEFSMGVFCLPTGATIPLHDHPGMTVLSRVLYGSLSVNAYDWIKPPDSNHPNSVGLVSSTFNDKICDSTSPASVLYPRSGGNIHSVTALTPCGFLDVLTPPYSDAKGRPSTYYSEIPIPFLPGFVILEREVGIPKNLSVTSAPYNGPELFL